MRAPRRARGVRLFTRAISRSARARFFADFGGEPYAFVRGHDDWSAALDVSEEHLPIDLPAGVPGPARGTPLLLWPQHVCPSVNLHEEAVLVHEDERLEIAPVAARAHAPWA